MFVEYNIPMRRILSFSAILLSFAMLSFSSLNAQKSKSSKASKTAIPASKTPVNPIVLTVGPESISYSDLESAFRRNMNRKNVRLADVSRDSVLDFMKLYANYRLKVLDAYGRKVDQDSNVKVDIEQNRKLLADNYFFEKKIVDPTIDKMLERRKRELQVAIIFVEKKSDTIASFQKAQRLLGIVRAGADFEKIARDSSEDRETGNKGGVLPFITSGRILRTVEDAAYSVAPGQICPTIVNARGGYFIVKTLRNEPRIRVRGSHILVFMSGKDDSLNASKKADSLLGLLKAGQSFETIAKTHSDDASSKDKGGYLGAWYIRSKGLEGASGDVLHPEFEKALFELKDGQISGKVLTDYGIHIIRRDSTQVVNLEIEKEAAKKEYKRIYFEEDKRKMLDSLKLAYGWKLNSEALANMLSKTDTIKVISDTIAFQYVNNRSDILYSMGDKGYISVGGFVDTTKRAEYRAISANYMGCIRAIDKMSDPLIMKLATESLEKEFADFSGLMKEFRDGILLFKVEEQEVWSKLKFDSLAARAYWDSTKTRYKTELKYDMSEIYVSNDSLAKALKARIDAGEKFDNIAGEYTERSGFKEKKGRYTAQSIKESKFSAIAEKKQLMPGDIYGPESFERGYIILRVNEIIQPREKRFEEAISDFAPAYQDQVQKRFTEQWLSRIAVNYPVTKHIDKLDEILKKK